MKRYIMSKTFINRVTRERIEIERATKILTIKYIVGDGYYKNGRSYDCYKFVDAEGNSWQYDFSTDYNGTATGAVGRALQELDKGDSVKLSGYFIPSGQDRFPGTILNPRVLH